MRGEVRGEEDLKGMINEPGPPPKFEGDLALDISPCPVPKERRLHRVKVAPEIAHGPVQAVCLQLSPPAPRRKPLVYLSKSHQICTMPLP